MRQVDLVNVFDSAGESALSAGVKDARIAELEAENRRLKALLKTAAKRLQADMAARNDQNQAQALH